MSNAKTRANIKQLPIVINLDTNIPDGYNDDGSVKTKQLVLNSSMLSFSDGKKSGGSVGGAGGGEAFFSTDVLYEDGASYFSKFKTAKEKTAVFFDATKFREFLQVCAKTRREYDIKQSLETPADYAHKNVAFMCNMMFSVIFPVKKKVAETYSGFHMTIPSLGAKLTNILNISKPYTYFTDGGKTYTVTSVAWQNDFSSFPQYGKFMKTFEKYDVWYKNMKSKMFEIVPDTTGEKRFVFKNDTIKSYYKAYVKATNTTNFYQAEIIEYIFAAFGEKLLSLEEAIEYIYDIYVFEITGIKSGGAKKKSKSSGIRKQYKTKLYSEYQEPDIITTEINFAYQLAKSKLSEKKYQIEFELDDKALKKLISNIESIFKTNKQWNDVMNAANEIKNSKMQGNRQLNCLLKNIKSMNKPLNQLSCKDPKDFDDTTETVFSDTRLIKDVIHSRGFYVGVQKNAEGKFVISLMMDVVGGKVTRKLEGKFACIYSGEQLGSDLTELVDNNDLSPEVPRFYVDLENTKEGKEAIKESEAAPDAPAAAGGGKTHRRYSHRRKKYTRRYKSKK